MRVSLRIKEWIHHRQLLLKHFAVRTTLVSTKDFAVIQLVAVEMPFVNRAEGIECAHVSLAGSEIQHLPCLRLG